MKRLARLLPLSLSSRPLRPFGHPRHLRGMVSCPAHRMKTSVPGTASPSGEPWERETTDGYQSVAVPALPSAQPAFAHVSLNGALHGSEPARRAPVLVYHGPSRFILVGTIDAICRMLGRGIGRKTGCS